MSNVMVSFYILHIYFRGGVGGGGQGLDDLEYAWGWAKPDYLICACSVLLVLARRDGLLSLHVTPGSG